MILVASSNTLGVLQRQNPVNTAHRIIRMEKLLQRNRKIQDSIEFLVKELRFRTALKIHPQNFEISKIAENWEKFSASPKIFPNFRRFLKFRNFAQAPQVWASISIKLEHFALNCV